MNIHQFANSNDDEQDRALDNAQLQKILDMQQEGLEEIKALKAAFAEYAKMHDRQLTSLKGHIIQLAKPPEEKKEEKERQLEKKPDDKKSAETSDDFVLAAAYYQTALAHQDKKEWEKAVESHRKAADKGHVQAMATLGFFHLKGLGIQQNKTAAFGFFFKAAAKGHARAQYNLALMLKKGDGIPKDFEQAKIWFQKSAAQGHEEAKKHLQHL